MHYFACVPVHHMHAVPTEVGRASPCDWSYSLKEPWWCWESSPGSLGEHCVCVCVCVCGVMCTITPVQETMEAKGGYHT